MPASVKRRRAALSIQAQASPSTAYASAVSHTHSLVHARLRMYDFRPVAGKGVIVTAINGADKGQGFVRYTQRFP